MKRRYKDSHLFKKKLDKLKGQDLFNIMNKIEEILTIKDLDFYKNLKHDLKKFKRCSTIIDSWHIFSRKYCYM